MTKDILDEATEFVHKRQAEIATGNKFAKFWGCLLCQADDPEAKQIEDYITNRIKNIRFQESKERGELLFNAWKEGLTEQERKDLENFLDEEYG